MVFPHVPFWCRFLQGFFFAFSCFGISLELPRSPDFLEGGRGSPGTASANEDLFPEGCNRTFISTFLQYSGARFFCPPVPLWCRSLRGSPFHVSLVFGFPCCFRPKRPTSEFLESLSTLLDRRSPLPRPHLPHTNSQWFDPPILSSGRKGQSSE